jgi:hypothetical protein
MGMTSIVHDKEKKGVEIRLLRGGRWTSVGIYEVAVIETARKPYSDSIGNLTASESVEMTLRFQKRLRTSKFSRQVRLRAEPEYVEGFRAITLYENPGTVVTGVFGKKVPVLLSKWDGGGVEWVVSGTLRRGTERALFFKRRGTGRVSGR